MTCLHGYTQGLDVLRTVMSADEIVSLNIDPWRLDLLDPDPVRTKVKVLARDVSRRAAETWILSNNITGEPVLSDKEYELHFRRLRDIVIAYCPTDNPSLIYIAMMDEHGEVCGVGERVDDNAYLRFTVDNWRLTGRSFKEHLREYLSNDFRQLAAISPGGLAFEGSSLRLELASHRLNAGIGPRFCGRMFEEHVCGVALGPQINWVLERLKPWRPCVFGTALRSALRQLPVRRVDVYLDQAALPAVVQLGATGSPRGPRELVRDGCKYVFWLHNAVSLDDKLKNHPEPYACDWLYSDQEDQVCGSRIAFNDVGHSLARILHSRTADSIREEATRRLDLLDEGLTITGGTPFGLSLFESDHINLSALKQRQQREME